MAKQELLATIRDRYRASSRKERSVNGGGKVGHVGDLIVDSPSPSGTFCRRP